MPRRSTAILTALVTGLLIAPGTLALAGGGPDVSAATRRSCPFFDNVEEIVVLGTGVETGTIQDVLCMDRGPHVFVQMGEELYVALWDDDGDYYLYYNGDTRGSLHGLDGTVHYGVRHEGSGVASVTLTYLET